MNEVSSEVNEVSFEVNEVSFEVNVDNDLFAAGRIDDHRRLILVTASSKRFASALSYVFAFKFLVARRQSMRQRY